MKLQNFFLLSIGVIFIITISFLGGRHFQKNNWKNRIRKEKARNEEQIGQSIVHPKTKTPYPILEDKSFVVVIPSYNNSKWCKKNIQGVLDQDYEKFRVIYIDDCSKDDTFEKVQAIVNSSEKKDKVQLIKNKKNQGALLNLFQAIHSCDDHEIIVTLDGDDFLPHEFVLSALNGYYANPDVWMTFGQYLDYPTYVKGMGGPIYKRKLKERGGIRAYDWVSTHLRTFYAGLFKKIKLKDFFYQGTFFKMGWDYAFMMPMLEMCKDKFLYVPEVMYLYNRCNPISDDRKNLHLQAQSAIYVRFKEAYKPLDKVPYLSSKEDKHDRADVLISSTHPIQLQTCLDSIQYYAKNYENIYVILQGNHFTNDIVDKLKKKYSHIAFFDKQHSNSKIAMNMILLKKNNYILLSCDSMILRDYIDLKRCAQILSDTLSHGFYFQLGNNIQVNSHTKDPLPEPKKIEIFEDVFAWEYNNGLDEWRYPENNKMVLFRKQDLIIASQKAKGKDLDSFLAEISKNIDKEEVGLFYNHSKAICLKNHNLKELNDQIVDLEQVSKIDFHRYHNFQNDSIVVDIDLEKVNHPSLKEGA